MKTFSIRDPGYMGTAAAGGPPFIDTTDMKLWFDGTVGVKLAGGAASDGGEVDEWENQISTTDALQAGASNLRPIYRQSGGPNSQPCLEFDGSNDFLEMANGTDTNMTNAMSFWCVLNSAAFTTHNTLFAKNLNSASANWSSYIQPAPFAGRVSFCQSSCSESGANLMSTTTWYSMFIRVTAGNIAQIYWDNAFKGQLGSGSASNTNPAYLGRRIDGLYHQGKIAEFGAWDRDVSEAERAVLNTYSVDKYGV